MKKFTMFFMAIFAALSLQAAELNIYACGLNATVSDNVATVEYVLNAPATGLELQLYAAGADPILVPITAAEALTKGAHSVEVDLSAVKAGTYTWGLKASAAATAAYAEVTNDSTDAWKFYSPQGIAVNQNPESPFFGNVYVTMPSPGQASDGGCARTKTQKAGLYIFNSRLEALNDSAYQFGLTFEVGKREQFKRISVSPNDDKLYVNDITHKKVYIIDPNDLTKLDSTIEAAGHFTYPASLVASPRYWFLLDYPNTETGGALVRFNKTTGAMDTLLQSTKWANGESSLAFDGRGGMWVCQYRGQFDVYPCISHLGTADTIDYLINKNSPADLQNLIDRSTGSTYSTRGAMAVSRSGHLLAMAMNRCARVYAVTYDESTGVPSMSIAYTTPTLGKNIDGMAFDAADNLYISSASSERLYVYATTKADNSFVTPAAAAKTIVVEGPKTLASVLADKTIRRVVNDQEHVYVLAVDTDKKPTLVKADFDGKIVTEYATDFCSKVGTVGLEMVLSDIALTEDGVLIGCNLENCKFSEPTATNPFNVYGWNEDGTGSVVFAYTKPFWASACWNNGLTGVTMAYKGTLVKGQMLVAGRHGNDLASQRHKQVLIAINDSAVLHATVNEGQSYTGMALPDLQNVNHPDSAKFITLASNKVPQLFEYTDTGVAAAKTETLKGALAATYSGAKGVSVAKKDAAVWMMIPSISGVEILNITAGLTSAPQEHNLAAASSLEADFLYAGLVEDGEKVVLMRGTSLELIDIPGTGTELEEIEAADAEVKKVIINGRIFIIREGHMYDMNGMQVK